jgi:hypothetical protein
MIEIKLTMKSLIIYHYSACINSIELAKSVIIGTVLLRHQELALSNKIFYLPC